jgi:type II secretory pathway predicted ATPase ExeA
MDAIRKQAKAFREQVAKQQQAVLKQFSGHGSQGDMVITDEAELLRHQQLERLYISTKAAKVANPATFVVQLITNAY